jgi:hypothetical protein
LSVVAGNPPHCGRLTSPFDEVMRYAA